MIVLNHLSIGHSRHPVLRDLSVTFPGGELTALLGRNGSGKSTLLRTVAGLLKPLSGSVLIDGADISTLSRNGVAKKISLSTAAGVRIPHLKCRDLVAMGRAPWTNWAGRLHQDDERIIDRAIELVGMQDYADREAGRMSDGECQKILIARALAQDTPAMLLDEPTAFLDVPGRLQVISILAKLASEEHKTIVFSTHDVGIALEKADNVFLIGWDGCYFGKASDPETASVIRRAFIGDSGECVSRDGR